MPAISAASDSVRFLTSLPKIDLRRLGDAVQRERAAIAEIDVVQIQLEDLVLGRLGLEDQRHELLEDLAAVRALAASAARAAICSVRKKLRASCCVMVLPPTRYGRLPKMLVNTAPTMRIGSTPGMVVEAAVLDREHRLLHPRRNGVERDAAALLARAGHQRGQQRRVERDALDALACGLDSDDALRRRRRRLRGLLADDRRLRERHGDDLAGLIAAARQQDDGAAIDREFAGALDARRAARSRRR